MKPPIAGLLVSAALCPAWTSADPITDARLDAIVTQEATDIARQWTITPRFRITDGEWLEVTPDGTLEIGRAALRTVLATIGSDRQRMVIRWIIAHETWHQVQRRDLSSAQLGEQHEKRLRECEADTIAAQHMVDTFLAEAGGTLRRSDAASQEQLAQSLGGVVKNVIGQLQAAEQNFAGNATHPSADQRRTAISLGSIRGIMPHLSLIDDAGVREASGMQMRKIVNYRENDRLADWAAQTCMMILHAGDGAGDLMEMARKIDFNKDGDPPVVDFQLPYRNIGKSTLHVAMQVMTIAVSRTRPADPDAWLKVDAENYRFDLAPGQEYTVGGRLLWYADADRYPRLVFPLSNVSLYSATRASSASSASSARGDGRRTPQLPPHLVKLASALLAIANAAPDQFKTIRGQPCRNARGEKTCPLTVDVPAAQEAEILYEADGSTSVDIVLYEGKDPARAEAVFNAFLNDLKTIDPFKPYRERTTKQGGKVVSFAPTSTSDFTLRSSQLSSGSCYVTATITATAVSGD